MSGKKTIDRELRHLTETDTIGSAFGNDDNEDAWLLSARPKPPEPIPSAMARSSSGQPKSATKGVRFATAPETPSEDGWSPSLVSLRKSRTTTATAVSAGSGFRSAPVLSDSALNRERRAGPAAPVMDSAASRLMGGPRDSDGSAASSAGMGDPSAIQPFRTRVNRHRFGAAAQPISASRRQPRVSAVPTVSTDTTHDGQRPSHNLADDEGLEVQLAISEEELLRAGMRSEVKLRDVNPNSRSLRFSTTSEVSLSSLSSSDGGWGAGGSASVKTKSKKKGISSKRQSKNSRVASGKSAVVSRRRDSLSTVDSHNEPVPRSSQPSSSARPRTAPSSQKGTGSRCHPEFYNAQAVPCVRGDSEMQVSDSDSGSNDGSSVPHTQIKSVRVDSSRNQTDWWAKDTTKKGKAQQGSGDEAMQEELEYLLYDVDGGEGDSHFHQREGNTTVCRRVMAGEGAGRTSSGNALSEASISELKRKAARESGRSSPSVPANPSSRTVKFHSVRKPASFTSPSETARRSSDGNDVVGSDPDPEPERQPMMSIKEHSRTALLRPSTGTTAEDSIESCEDDGTHDRRSATVWGVQAFTPAPRSETQAPAQRDDPSSRRRGQGMNKSPGTSTHLTRGEEDSATCRSQQQKDDPTKWEDERSPSAVAPETQRSVRSAAPKPVTHTPPINSALDQSLTKTEVQPQSTRSDAASPHDQDCSHRAGSQQVLPVSVDVFPVPTGRSSIRIMKSDPHKNVSSRSPPKDITSQSPKQQSQSTESVKETVIHPVYAPKEKTSACC